ILQLAEEFDLKVIEDAAHAVGAEYDGEKCGSLGDIGCFSFFSNKNMTSGEGGMVTTNSEELAEKLRLMRSHGMTTLTLERHKGHAHSYDVVDLGYNYRIDEMRSAMGLVQLAKLERNNKKRKEIVDLYQKTLAGVSRVGVPFTNPCGASSYHIFPVLLDADVNRDKLIEWLKERGIQSSIHYPPIHLFDFYRQNFGFMEGLLPITEDVVKRELTLPLYPSMSAQDVQYVCDAIAEYLTLS
ncbi:MAG: DegT/DnrJ/EryC1/StrS family aminotransferase, partial [Dehalococcoidia bacterium]